jgi:hypothetical protein
VNNQLFKDLSSTIVLNDRDFVSVSSSLTDSTIKMKAEDGSVSSVSWILRYRASRDGYKASDFHLTCDGMGKCVVVVKAENGRIAVAYNEDGFTSRESYSPNLNGFIATVTDDGGCGEIFHQNDQELGVVNHPDFGPWFGLKDLVISNNCHLSKSSRSRLGGAYARGLGLNQFALFGQEWIRVVDYEVFKIVIE